MNNKFTIELKEEWYNKNNTIELEDNIKLKIIKVYKYNWYRKILNFFGIKFKMFDCIEIEHKNKNK